MKPCKQAIVRADPEVALLILQNVHNEIFFKIGVFAVEVGDFQKYNKKQNA